MLTPLCAWPADCTVSREGPPDNVGDSRVHRARVPALPLRSPRHLLHRGRAANGGQLPPKPNDLGGCRHGHMDILLPDVYVCAANRVPSMAPCAVPRCLVALGRLSGGARAAAIELACHRVAEPPRGVPLPNQSRQWRPLRVVATFAYPFTARLASPPSLVVVVFVLAPRRPVGLQSHLPRRVGQPMFVCVRVMLQLPPQRLGLRFSPGT